MLYCKFLLTHQPHALIRNIDVSKALALPGVLAVITGKDLTIPYGILPVSQDEHALCVDKVRFIGDPVAAGAPTSAEGAAPPPGLIKVVHQPLQSSPSPRGGPPPPHPRIHHHGGGGYPANDSHRQFRPD